MLLINLFLSVVFCLHFRSSLRCLDPRQQPERYYEIRTLLPSVRLSVRACSWDGIFSFLFSIILETHTKLCVRESDFFLKKRCLPQNLGKRTKNRIFELIEKFGHKFFSEFGL